MRLGVFKTHRDQDDRKITDDQVVEELVICGTVNHVVDQILTLREEAGDFGELVYAGMNWVDPALGKRSMELMANQVMPRVNKAIGAVASAPARRAAAKWATLWPRPGLFRSCVAAIGSRRGIQRSHRVNFLYDLEKSAGLTGSRDSIIMTVRVTARWFSGGGSGSGPVCATIAP